MRSFRGADCDSDHYLVIANVRERLAVGQQAAQKFYRQRFNLRKLNEPEVREQYQKRGWDVGIWTGLGWPRIETGGGRL